MQQKQPGFAIEQKPLMQIDPTTDESVTRRIRLLERSIHRHPDRFIAAMETLGSNATAGTIQIQNTESRETTLKRDPSQQLLEFFTNRYDLAIEFDNETERAIVKDAAHVDLLRKQQTVRAQRRQQPAKKGAALPEPPEAYLIRDALRRQRLIVFIGRVSSFKTEHESTLSSAV